MKGTRGVTKAYVVVSYKGGLRSGRSILVGFSLSKAKAMQMAREFEGGPWHVDVHEFVDGVIHGFDHANTLVRNLESERHGKHIPEWNVESNTQWMQSKGVQG